MRVVLQVVLDKFIRVQFRCIRRQENDFQSNRYGLDKRAHRFFLVCRMPIDNQDVLVHGVVNQAAQKSDNTPALTQPLTHMKRKSPCWLTSEMRFSPKPAPMLDTISVCPRGAHVLPALGVGTYTRFVFEPDLHFLPLRLGTDRKKRLPQPPLDLRRILLVGMPLRVLCRQTQLIEKLAYRGSTQTNVKALLYQFTHHMARPQSK